MHIEFLVEEPSMEAFLQNIVPKIIGEEISFNIYPHEGKYDLLSKLPNRLKGYNHWLPNDYRIVVIVDKDREDCLNLKGTLEAAAINAGFVTATSIGMNGIFHVLNRIAIEELEAWFFGDVEALIKAYPGVPSSLAKKSKYRIPDAIGGGTWEALEKVLRRAGYYKGGLPKIKTARDISLHMNPMQNRSKSFQVFRYGLLRLKSQV